MPKVISITGTKGKTSVALLLSHTLFLSRKKVFCISSEGVFSNGKLVHNNDYFLKKYGTSANASALKELSHKDILKYDFLILENSFSNHKNISKSFLKNSVDISILTNVYWDHIDGDKIKDQRALLAKKIQLLLATKIGGTVFIYTGDSPDNIASEAIEKIKRVRPDINIIAYNEKLPTKKNSSSTSNLCLNEGWITLNKMPFLDFNKISIDFKDIFTPTKINVLVLAGMLKALGLNPEILYRIKNSSQIIPGRLNWFSHNGYHVILDYAHEIKSLSFSEKFIRQNFEQKSIVAIIRFSYYRKDAYIRNLTTQVSGLFDKFIVYDKAISRTNMSVLFSKKYGRKAGDVGELMYSILNNLGKPVKKIDDELKAIRFAIGALKKNEILYIMGDQINKDIATIKKSLLKK